MTNYVTLEMFSCPGEMSRTGSRRAQSIPSMVSRELQSYFTAITDLIEFGGNVIMASVKVQIIRKKSQKFFLNIF